MRIELMMALRQTDLPVPVRPAIKRCGSEARSATIGAPTASDPRNKGIFIFLICFSHCSMTPRKRTIWRVSLGTSTPTLFLPGIGATIRTLGTRIAMAKSSAKATIFCRRKPGSRSISYWEMTGPVSISTTLTTKPNCLQVFSKISALISASRFCCSNGSESAASSISNGGSS